MEQASPIRRFSSRRQKLAQSFLAERLSGAKAYDRIAGSSCAPILETAGDVPERTWVSVQPSAFSFKWQRGALGTNPVGRALRG